jgi:type I restriction enzyme S subunit
VIDCLDGRRIPLNAEQRADLQGSVPYWGANGVIDWLSGHLFDEPLVLLGEDGAPFFDSGKPVAFYVDGLIWPNNHVHVLRPRNIEPRFLAYCLNSVDYGLYVTGSTRDKLTQEDLLRIEVPHPRLSEQRRIADFLDVETSRLDRLASNRGSTLALIAERRAVAVESEILGAAAEHRVPAAYGPFGLVPADWGQGRLRDLRCEVQTGPFGSQLHAEDYVDGGWPVVNPANIARTGLIADPSATVDDATRQRLGHHVLREGDVVFGRRGELGRAGIVTTAEAGWLCGTGSLRVRFQSGQFNPDYLQRFLGIHPVRYYFEMNSVGSTMANLNSRILLSLPMVFPARDEQDAIAARCTSVESEHDSLLSSVERQLGLLSARRQAFITAAVTGQIDVTTARGVEVA